METLPHNNVFYVAGVSQHRVTRRAGCPVPGSPKRASARGAPLVSGGTRPGAARTTRCAERVGLEPVPAYDGVFVAVEFGKTADDYARHRAGFPESLFDRLATFGIGLTGQEVVDVGAGTGTVARHFARRGCRVVGIDPAPQMTDEARLVDAAVGVHVEYRPGTGEATGLPSECYDIVSASQCWHLIQ
jgi:2-polyprenyl-3-methyl-5-hydroxy-6-metoxy-1,4-benzoquinol methylase